MEQEKNFQQSGKRRIKVHGKHVSRTYQRYVVFPEIRLCRKWLDKLGFKQGQTVIIDEENNKLIITLDNEKA